MKKFKITIEQKDARLDVFLAEQLKDVSRSQVQKLVKQGEVLVNGKIPTPHYKIKEADIVNVKNIEIKQTAKEKKEFVVPEVEIIENNDEYVVVNKPAGLIVHGAKHIKEPTLVDILVKKYPKIKKVGEDPDRPGIMHRLDKDVSGLMVVAKTQASFDNLKRQFQERTMTKKYVGLVHGVLSKDEDIINFNIERSTSGHKMAAKPSTVKGELNPEGKIAITEFKTIKKFFNFTLLDIKIKTGRTHQIRAHMAAYCHPIVGDTIYGTNRTNLANKKIGLKRCFLVATKLSLVNLAGEKKEYKIDIPKELKELLKNIK